MPTALGKLNRSAGGLFLVAIAILGLIIAASFWLALQINTSSADLTRQRQTVGAARSILIALQDIETGQRGYVLTSDRDYLAPFERSRLQLPKFRETLWTLLGNSPDYADEMARLDGAITSKLAEVDLIVALVAAGETQKAVEVVRSDQGKLYMDAAREALNVIIADGNVLMANIGSDLDTAAAGAFWVTGVGAFAVILVAVGAYWLVARFSRQEIRARLEIEALNTGLEERVEERTLALTRANEEVQRFAYIVSHDLRAPLVNIVGFSSELDTSVVQMRQFIDSLPADGIDPALLAQARECVTEDMPESVEFIRASTTKMDKLINAILRLSREGRRDLHAERVDLGELISRSLAAVKHQLDESSTTVEVQPALPMVSSDRLALEQIFGNIIDNAIKYQMPGRPGRIDVTFTRTLREVTVTVADNGRGIAPQDHERIFDLFRRAGRQDKPGEGIGLAHVRALVRRLGGDITVQSAAGEGSRFLIRIPLVLAKENATTAAAS